MNAAFASAVGLPVWIRPDGGCRCCGGMTAALTCGAMGLSHEQRLV